MKRITAQKFYEIWVEVVNKRKDDLLECWNNWKLYTSCILEDDNSIISQVANKLNLLCYSQNYYSIDAVLYTSDNKTPNTPALSCWLRDINISFEHENNFNSGLFKEVSHLLITNCDLRVLVTYPEKDPTNELKYLHDIISGSKHSKLISDEMSFLIIFGYEDNFTWKGLLYHKDNWIDIIY